MLAESAYLKKRYKQRMEAEQLEVNSPICFWFEKQSYIIRECLIVSTKNPFWFETNSLLREEMPLNSILELEEC